MNGSVLVIEDDFDNLESISDLLREEGLDVLEARNGREARRCFAEIRRPCLILIDYLLPDTTGADLLAEIRRNEHLADVPVVIITAVTHPSIGAIPVPVLKKPVTLEDLLNVLRRYCVVDGGTRPAA